MDAQVNILCKVIWQCCVVNSTPCFPEEQLVGEAIQINC